MLRSSRSSGLRRAVTVSSFVSLASPACQSASPGASQPGLDFGDSGADASSTLHPTDAGQTAQPKPAPTDAQWPSGISYLPWDAGLSGGTQRIASGLRTNLPARLYDWNGALAADTELFWGVTGATVGAGSIVRADLDGKNYVTLASATSPAALATDATNVYWLDLITGPSFETHVMQAPRGGGAAITLATTTSAGQCLAVTGNTVVWSAAGAFTSTGPNEGGWVPGDGVVATVPVGGGTAVTLGTIPDTYANTCVTTDGTRAYWTSSTFTTNAVVSAPLAGGTSTTLAASTSWVPEYITETGDTLYVSTQSGQILTLPTAGGTPTMLAAMANDRAGFAVAPYGVFFSSVLSSYIGALPADGGAPEQVAWWGNGELAVQAVAATSKALYWMAYENTGGSTFILGLDLPAPPSTSK